MACSLSVKRRVAPTLAATSRGISGTGLANSARAIGMEAEEPRAARERQGEDEVLARQGDEELESLPPFPETALEQLLESEEDPVTKELIAHVISIRRSISIITPVPLPDMVRGYDDAVEGGGQWLLDYTKANQKHHHEMDERQARLYERGQLFAFILGIIGFAGGLYLVSTGAELSGFSTFIVSLASLVGLFIYNSRQSGASETKPARTQDEAEENDV